MKRITLLLLLFLMSTSMLTAQMTWGWEPIDHQGNRTQTYPKVTTINPEIQAMVDQVDTNNLYNSIAWLQQFIREAYSPEALLTQNWLIERYEEYGLETSIHYFIDEENDTLDAGNVVAIQPGTQYPDEYIVVSAHYDHQSGPGADDNASGTSGVLEVARILSQYSFKRSILYINFNDEEYGCLGSMGYVQDCARQDMNILGVFNLDMIGWYPPELDTLKMYTAYYHLTKSLYDYYTSVANLYLPETPTLRLSNGLGNSDNKRFYSYDYPALYLGDIENLYLHPCYHRPCDTIGNGVNNFTLAGAFTKAVLAATAELADGELPPQHFAATCDSSTIYLRWDEVEGANSYRVFKDDVLLTETNLNHAEDHDTNDGQMHEYYVVEIKSDGTENNESNHDKMMATPALSLPFSNDFNNDTIGFRLWDNTWTRWLRGGQNDYYLGSKALTKYDGGLFSIAETDWFSIPSDVHNVTMSFDYYVTPFFYYYSDSKTGRFRIELTTDRIRWHLLDVLCSSNPYWHYVELSLNDYIGQPFVQIRFLAEDERDLNYNELYGIDNFTIDFSGVGISETHYDPFTSLEICPNPTTSQVEIRTDMDQTYLLCIYNLMGVKIMEINEFQDGNLDLSALPAGVYFIKATKGQKSIAKRIVKQ